jgi:deoxyribodipyrimidine photo-lyase
MTAIVWFRQDLRKQDNPALAAAAKAGDVLPVFILEDQAGLPWRLGGAGRWWLHHSLTALRKDLGHLLLLRGTAQDVLPALVKQTKADAVYWNRCYEPHAIERDRQLKTTLRASGVEVESFNGNLLHEPWEVTSRRSEPIKVFTPFWRASRAKPIATPMHVPKVTLDRLAIHGERLEDWDLLPAKPNWAAAWEKQWQPGEAGALARFKAFTRHTLTDYGPHRDRPDLAGTSMLSPHLHWGEISPRHIWADIAPALDDARQPEGAEKFLSELGWREFAYHLLYHFPTMPEENWRPEFGAFLWQGEADDLAAWQHGRTGYPMLDAGMRQLWQTGWMHNRVRMITASFLIKHLRIDWRQGEAWFWDTLVDADLANNAMNWQWVAGSGADASPYFRVFNPTLQGKKFDPDGMYIRRWCPELARLSNSDIHAPFDATPAALSRAGVSLGETYPRPIVNHEQARKAALAGYQKVRSSKIA